MNIVLRIAVVAALLLGGASVWATGINVTFEGGSGNITNIGTWGITATPVANPEWACVVSNSGFTTSPCPGDGTNTGPYAGANHTPSGQWGLRFGTPNDGRPVESLTLVVPTVNGNLYDVSYWIRLIDPTITDPQEYIGAAGALFTATLGGSTVLNNAIFVNHPFLQESGFSIVATGGTTNLVFTGLASLEGDFYIDDIVVKDSQIPEPSTLALMLVPLAGLAGWLRRRR